MPSQLSLGLSLWLRVDDERDRGWGKTWWLEENRPQNGGVPYFRLHPPKKKKSSIGPVYNDSSYGGAVCWVIVLFNTPPFRSWAVAVNCSQASFSAQHVSHCPLSSLGPSSRPVTGDQLSFPTYFYALANVAMGSEISWGFPVRGHLFDLCPCREVQKVVKD
jgi:hypothetical protein